MKQKDFRCSNCGRLLFKGTLILGNIEVKCRCHYLNEFIEGVCLDDKAIKVVT